MNASVTKILNSIAITKKINILSILTLSLTFSNCTAWPAVAALLGLTGNSKSSPPLIIPPSGGGAGSPASENSANPSPSPAPTPELPTDTSPIAIPSNIILSTTTSTGFYPESTVIDITVKFTEAVTVTGTPRLNLNNTVYANYLSGSGTDTLTFRYTVQAGNGEDIVGLDAASQTALSLNGGTIQSVANNTDMALTLPAPGAPNSFGNGKIIVIDTTTPIITGVTSSSSDAVYGLGAIITIQVLFSEVINVVGGTPQLTLETGTTDRTINCNSGTGTNTLSCIYTVQAGDTSTDLDYTATNSFSLNGATIRDGALHNSVLTLATPGGTNSLGANKAIVVNTNLPSITNVTSSLPNGAYTIGQIIPIQVTFSQAVNVTGIPQLTLETGATDSILNYTSGSGTNTLTFNYTVALGHGSLDLDYISSSALTLNGGTIKDSGNINDAILTLATPGAANSLGANRTIIVDTNSPAVLGVTSSTPDGSYRAGQSVSIQVNFDENIVVIGTPQLTLDNGAVVNYSSGSGTSTLTFTYTIGAGQTSNDLDYQSTSALGLNGGSISDSAGNAASLTLAAPGSTNSLGSNKAISVDTTSAAVTSVNSSTSDGSYKSGQTISIQVNFSENVTVTGTPTLTLETGGTDAIVNYTSGSGTSTLTFTYTVGAGHTSTDLDYASNAALTLAGGTINDSAGNSSNLTLPTPGTTNSLGASKAIVIDTTSPTVTSVNSSTPNGTYKTGDVISIQINFSENVTVTGTPQLTLETGGTDAVINYASGTGTSLLTFTYTVIAGNTSSDLDYVNTNSLALNGGTISDAAGNASTLTLAAPAAANSLGANKAIIIDATSPTVTSVNSSTANGTYKAGQIVSIQVNFSENVTVTGTPQLTLETGTTDAIVDYVSGSGTSALTFTYTVGAAQASNDLDYQSTTALALNGGTVKDSAGNDATLTLASPSAVNSLSSNKAIVIDTSSPNITGVTSSTADGIYGVGQVISIQVSFSEAVTVTGTPQITLETGTTDAIVNYASGSGTSTLSFTYTIGTGHASGDLDYQSTTALALNSGSIKDTVGNDAILTLATPGAANSLGANKALVIDAVFPTVTDVTSSTGNGMYGIGQSISIQVLFSKTVIVTGTPQLTLETGTSDAVVNYASGSGSNTLTFTYTVASGHTSADLDYQSTAALTLNGGTIRDSANNNATLTLAAMGGLNSLAANKAIVINTATPTVSFSAATSSTAETTTTVTIPVILSAVSALSVTVDYTVTGGTATGAGTDYTLSNGTLTFAQGETSKDITITVVNDALREADETIILGISNPANATLGATTSHTYTINNDDPLPTVQFSAATSSSGDESSTTRTVEITLSEASGQTVTVSVSDSGGTATSGTDYTSLGSPVTVTFSAGVTAQNINIPVLQDLEYEDNETVHLTLSAPSNATLGGTTAHTLTITDDDVGIASAETMDADNDGKIDHYKLTFSEAVNDSTFPGYVLNSPGNAQTNWLVAGYSGVVLAHGSAAPEADSLNDSIIYLRFNEGVSSDTDAKPNLTTTATPTLVTAGGKTIGRIYTATVVESDRAKPVLVSATAQTGTTLITLTFSEPVWTATGMPACGAGGELGSADFIYNNVSGNNASSLVSMGADTCGTDLVVNVNSNSALMPADNTDTIVATTGIFDAANNNGNPTVSAIVVTGGPTISSIDLYDTNKNGKIDQAKITFSINVNDATIDDTDASRFTIGGTTAIKVDTATSGTGLIASPNNDTGVSNDSIVTIFTDDFTLSGTDLKSMSFSQNTGRWMGNGTELATVAVLTSVTNDKAPPVILTAVAAENSIASATVDNDDTLVITFSESTNKPTINSGNIASILSLSNSHVWGNVTSATWNGPGDVLTLTFAGTGSPTVAVGDYITIVGTITDTATDPNTSVNIPSVNPISGNFSVEAPSISSASSTSATTIRVVFNENVNNAEATTLGNYKIALSNAVTGNCNDNSNFSSAANLTFSAIVKVDDKTYDFTTANQTNGASYTVLANKNNIHHKDYPTYTLTCPNNANFIGQEKLRITSVTCSSLTSLVVTFSKPVNSGMNVSGSAECNTTTECNKRYVIKGIVSGTEVGSMTQAKILDGTVCGGQAANSSKVCITHTLNQNGSIYTLVAANATDSDGFNDSAWSAIQSTAENLQASPKDRASFTGCGTTPHNFVDGPVVTDPFGDGTTFGYLNKYQNKIYIGPNQKGNGATRFEADGSSPENLTFELLKDSTGSRTSGSTASAPFASIGYTGCTADNSSATGCGPNDENGRGLFATGTFGGTEYLFITGANTAGNNDYLYFTPDLDSVLNFNYIDASWVFDNYDPTCNATWRSNVTQNQVTESIHVFNGKVYWSVPGDGTNRPFAVTIGSLTNEVTCNNTTNAYLNMRYMSGVGRLHATKPAQADIMGGIFNSFNDRVYFANSGSISYSKVSSPVCIEGSTYSAGVCEQTGGIVRSVNNNPAGCTSAGGCPDWVDITPSSVDYKKYFTIGLEAITDLIPAQKPIPNMETYKNNFYFIRNACTQALWDDGTATGGDSNNNCGFNASCGTTNKNDKVCPLGAEIPQLWKCVPSFSGSATECDADDWSLVAQNGITGKTNFGDANNRKITMLSANGDYLYVGFDNSTTGIEVWRTNLANPSTAGDFSQIGGDGFGAGTAITEVYSHISLQSGSIYYLYLSVGKNSIPVRVHRQQNEAPVVFAIESINTMLAYINQGNNAKYPIGLGFLVFGILAFFTFRRFVGGSIHE